MHNSTRYHKATHLPKCNSRVKNIGFYIGQKNKCSIYVRGSFASERNIHQKQEAVGITSYMVQLKEGITLTAKEQGYWTPKINSLMLVISV